MRGCLIETGLFNLAKTMVSVLHKELEYKVEKLNRSCSRGSKTSLSFQFVNKARLIRGRGLNRGFTVTRIEQLVPKYSLTGGFLRRLKTNMKHCETSLYIPNWNFFGWVCGTGAELSALCAAPCARWNHSFILLKKVGATKLIKTDLWLWRWLPHRLSKRQSLSTKTTVQ